MENLVKESLDAFLTEEKIEATWESPVMTANDVVEGNLKVKGTIEVGPPKKEEMVHENLQNEPMINIKKYTQLGDLCFDLLAEKKHLGDNVLENKDEIWQFIDERLNGFGYITVQPQDLSGGVKLGGVCD